MNTFWSLWRDEADFSASWLAASQPLLWGPLLGLGGRWDLPLRFRRRKGLIQDSELPFPRFPRLLDYVGEMGYTVEFNQSS